MSLVAYKLLKDGNSAFWGLIFWILHSTLFQRAFPLWLKDLTCEVRYLALPEQLANLVKTPDKSIYLPEANFHPL